jgi:DNA-binding transcriptional MerR regulator
MLNVTPRTVGRYAREGKLPYRRTIGGHRRYRLADVLAADGSAQRYPSGQQGGPGA